MTDDQQLASQSDTALERFLSHVTCLSDTLYAEGESEKSRIEYQLEDIDVTKGLVPDEGASDEEGTESFDLSDMLDEHNTSMDFGTANPSLEAFTMDVDSVFDET